MVIKDNKNNTVLIYEDNIGTQWYGKKGTKKILATQHPLYDGIDLKSKKLETIDIINSPYNLECIEDIEDLVNE